MVKEMTDIKVLRDLYLQDLGKMVNFDGKDRPRVRNIETWINVAKRPIMLEEGSECISLEGRNVWFISDTHFGHNNIIRFSDRPFDDIEEMEYMLIENYNEYVQEDDVCIWVGDVAFMGASEMNKLLKRMNGYKILVIGNHDFNKKKLRRMDFDEMHLIYQLEHEGLNLVMTHYPMGNLPERYDNIHGHLHKGGNSDTNNPQHINVNCEFHNYRPVHLDELTKMYKLRRTENV